MCAVPNMTVFCNSLISLFPGMLLKYCLSDFETVQLAAVSTGITFAFTFHMRRISVIRSLYFKIFSASFLNTFLSPEIASSINMHVPFLVSRIMMSGLLLGRVLSVRTCWFHNMVTLLSWLVSTDFGTWSYQCLLSNFTLVFLHILKCSWAHTPSCLFTCCSFADMAHADMVCSTVTSNCLQSLHLLSVSVCNFFLSHDVWFLMPDLVLLLFHFQFLLSDLPSTAKGTCLLR